MIIQFSHKKKGVDIIYQMNFIKILLYMQHKQ